MAKETIFQRLRNEAAGRELSVRWYRTKIEQIAPRLTANQMINRGKTTSRVNYGLMNLFLYKPLWAANLKYYDMFPLVLPFKFYRNGFCGVNFHYLSIPMRVNLLERLSEFEEEHELYRLDRNQPVAGRASSEAAMGTQGDILALTWQKIKGIRGVKPTVHRYLNKYVYTNFLKIELEDMAAGVLLPVERFKKGDIWNDKIEWVEPREVWRDSRRNVYG